MSIPQDDSDLEQARDFIETRLYPLLADFERQHGCPEHLSAVVLLVGAVENACAVGYPLDMVEDMCRKTWKRYHRSSGPSLGIVHEPPREAQ